MIHTAKGEQISYTVRNVLQGGALLEVHEPETLSVHFELIVGADRFEADCEIRHRTANGAGSLCTEFRIERGGRDTG